jgi:uncharacterized protein (TIGR01319 family)
VAAVDGRWLEAEGAGTEAAIRQAVSLRAENPDWIPGDENELRLDGLLAIGCATQALGRHCGTMLLTRATSGTPTLSREGADLREARLVLGTGGVFAHRDDGEWILGEALKRRGANSLAPVDPALAIDSNYILAAAGLLATEDRDGAIRLLRSELPPVLDWTN